MNRRARTLSVALMMAGLVAGIVALAATNTSFATSQGQERRTFTNEFFIEECDFNSTGTNPYLILEPGYQLVFRGEESDGTVVELTDTVLNETEVVQGVETRVFEERETADGELAEVSRNFFAICQQTNSVFYFGEDVDIYEGGEIVSHEGAWRAGEGNATAGIIMPGTVLLGARYFNENAPGVAEDQAEVISMTEQVQTPAGNFDNVLQIEETTPLEPGVRESKFFVRDIGLIQDGDLKLQQLPGEQ
jgi:hypothetical protein